MALKNIIPSVIFLILVSTELKCPRQQLDAGGNGATTPDRTADLFALLKATRSPQPQTVDMSPEAFEERLRASEDVEGGEGEQTTLRPVPGPRFISQEEVLAEQGRAPKPAPAAQTAQVRRAVTSAEIYASDPDMLTLVANAEQSRRAAAASAGFKSPELHPRHSSEAPGTGPASRPSSASKRQRPSSAAKRPGSAGGK